MLKKQPHFDKKANVWKMKSRVKKRITVNPFSTTSRWRSKIDKIVMATQKVTAFKNQDIKK